MAVTIILGTNSVTSCRTLVALKDQALLQVKPNPLRVSLTTPPSVSEVRGVRVVDNKPTPGGDKSIRVIAERSSVFILLGSFALVTAVQVSSTEINVQLDLRPIGINMHSDSTGLYIGQNQLSHNAINNCDTAIALG